MLVDELNDSAQLRVKKYLTVRTWGRIISFNERHVTKPRNIMGDSTLVSNSEKKYL